MNIIKSIKYGFYILIHPFDGFYCQKKEKRGSVASAVVLLALLILTSVMRITCSGYLYETVDVQKFSPLWQSVIILTAFVLFCVANWSLTTLMDGEGRFAEIFTATAYAMIPLILFNLPQAFLSNILIIDEKSFYVFFDILAAVWVIFLLLAGSCEIHGYTMTKTVGVMLLTIVVMLIIAVLFVLFFNLLQQVYVFIISIVKEASFRL